MHWDRAKIATSILPPLCIPINSTNMCWFRINFYLDQKETLWHHNGLMKILVIFWDIFPRNIALTGKRKKFFNFLFLIFYCLYIVIKHRKFETSSAIMIRATMTSVVKVCTVPSQVHWRYVNVPGSARPSFQSGCNRTFSSESDGFGSTFRENTQCLR